MKNNGFALTELITVLVIIGALLGIAALQFNDYNKKAKVESQVKGMHTEILAARSDSVFRRQSRMVKVTGGNLFTVYSSSVAANPVLSRTLAYTVTPADISVQFDERGMAATSAAICVTASADKAYVDSIVIKETLVQIGKLTGGGCAIANIVLK